MKPETFLGFFIAIKCICYPFCFFFLQTKTTDFPTFNIPEAGLIKRREPRISPGYYEHGPRLLLQENQRKIEPKEIPSC